MMKIKELIIELNKFDPNEEIIVWNETEEVVRASHLSYEKDTFPSKFEGVLIE